ncbi:attacin-C [Drosophila innubila]|uniref:attacin-C n=1 Tax=Drosophila innubila TaxID=198719 RepID=UPI00148BA139|nr:attacin-C [Drosophila innubila]
MTQTVASFIVVSIALLGVYATAMPQPEYSQVVRMRRQALGGSITSNTAGGADAKVALTQALGTPENNIIAQAFATGNTQSGPATSGATLALNSHGNGLEFAQKHTPGVIDSFKQTATANLFNDGVHNIDAKAFASQNQLANGLKFDRNGAGLDYAHISGHGASVTHSNIPGLGKQLELSGLANLWQSQDHNTRVDLSSTASKWLSGPFNGRSDFGANIGLSHYFN